MSAILVVAAHPDDEVLGCGGTIARMIREGNDVCVAILGEGITSRGESHASDRKRLQSSSLRAAEFLGVRDVRFFGLPDNRLDTLPLLDIIKTIEEVIADVKPETVYTHYYGDLNIDHVITHRAVLTATRPEGVCLVRNLYSFPIQSSTEWMFGDDARIFRPTMYVDISESLSIKMDAMSCYQTETRPFPHPRSLEAMEAEAKHWGSHVGLNAAEVFQCIRTVR